MACAALAMLSATGCIRSFRAIAIDPPGNETRPLTRQGETLRFTAGGIDADGFRVLIDHPIWSSSNERVFTVDEKGVVTAISSGRAELRANYQQFTDMVPVVVKIIGSIVLDPPDPQLLKVGSAIKFKAMVLDDHGQELRDFRVKWSKQGDAIANDDGLVLGVQHGDALLIARTGAAQTTIKITVVGSGKSPIPPTGL
jgi:hypothetical protein